jgi:hypothetical protein
MGPTIVGKDVVHKQVLTDPGLFAIIYGWGQWHDAVVPSPRQDGMLRIIVDVRTLDK